MSYDLSTRLRELDRAGIYQAYLEWPEAVVTQYRDVLEHFRLPEKITVRGRELRYRDVRGVVIAGMGGSGIVGDIVYDLLQDRSLKPLAVVKDYHLPTYVTEDFLVIAVSYSGNTEETISAYVEAVRRGCPVVTVSSGGVLREFAERLGTPHITLPTGKKPRAALPYMISAVLAVLELCEVTPHLGREVEECSEVLRRVVEENRAEVGGEALELAQDLRGKVPVIYGTTIYRGAALRLKNEFNENSKVIAVAAALPELDHNDIVGWEYPDVSPRVALPIFIRDEYEDPITRARVEATEQVLRELGVPYRELWASGEGRYARILSVCLKGGLASVYLGVLYGLDPSETRTIDILKREMGKRAKVVEKLRREVEELTGQR